MILIEAEEVRVNGGVKLNQIIFHKVGLFQMSEYLFCSALLLDLKLQRLLFIKFVSKRSEHVKVHFVPQCR